MKKFYLGIIAGLLCGLIIATATTGFASTGIRLIIDGNDVTTDPAPVMVNGRVFVPTRFVADVLGAKVEWKNNAVYIDNQKAIESMKLCDNLLANGLLGPTLGIMRRKTTPLEITGPDNFKRDISATLSLLKEKCPDIYQSIEDCIATISFEAEPSDPKGYIAYISSDEDTCYVNGPYYNEAIATTPSFAREIRLAATLTHETIHAQSWIGGFHEGALALDMEFLAELAEYRTYQKLGMSQDFLDWFADTYLNGFCPK